MTVELREHQQKAVDKLHNGAILYGGVGSGKTITALAYYYTKVMKGVLGDIGSLREPRDLYVITTAKKRDALDWESDAGQLGIGRSADTNPHGITITVDSWNNISKYVGVENAFFIFDEQRLVGTGAWVKSFIKIAKKNQWILLSATPGDVWLDYAPVFIANGWYKNITEFKRRHVVYNTYSKFPKVDRYVEVGTLVKHRNQILVHMPYERHTVRHSKEIRVDYDTELFEKVVKKRWHVYENRPLRDVAELFSVMRRVVNSNASRIQHVRQLMSTHPRLIVFYNFDYELEMLRTLTFSEPQSEFESDSKLSVSGPTMMEGNSEWKTGTPSSGTSIQISHSTQGTLCQSSSKRPDGLQKSSSESFMTLGPSESDEGTSHGKNIWQRAVTSNGQASSTQGSTRSSGKRQIQTFQVAEWNGHKHEPIPKTDRWVYLVQYVAGSEGWNCVETDAICFYSLTYSYKNWHQAHGRIDRLNTPFKDLYYYSLVSDSLIDKAVKKSLKEKRSFNESSIGLSI